MATTDNALLSRNIYGAIPTILRDPRAIQRLMVNTVEAVSNGEFRIIDPTSPFVLMMEMTAQLAAAGVAESDALNRRQYPTAATTVDDLLYHMSDYSMLGVYATPANGTPIIVLNLDSVRARAIPTTNPDVSMIIIPKHTSITVGGTYTFTMQYPIEIIVMSHGGVNVRYNLDEISPIYAAETMPLQTATFVKNGKEWMAINIPMKQMAIDSHVMQVNSASGTARSFTLSDKFCYIRAYHKSTDALVWTEIDVCMNKEIFDPKVASVVATVLGGTVEVSIPQIYITNQIISDSVRVDIYTTKGKLDVDLSNYTTAAYAATWRDYDNVNTSAYSKVLDDFNGITVASQKYVSGGSDAMTLSELRKRVVQMSSADYGYAITPNQVQQLLNVNGYDLVTSIDDITNRQFLATRLLPPPAANTNTDDSSVTDTTAITVTGIGVDVRTLQTPLSAFDLNRYAYINGQRITLTPNMLYRLEADALVVVPNETVDAIKLLGQTQPEALANTVNADTFLYTPFYTVLHTQSDNFTAHFYNLDTPKVLANYSKVFNSSAQISVTCTGYDIAAVNDNGYLLKVRFSGDAAWKKMPASRMYAQLTIADGTNRTWWNGTLDTPTDANGLLSGDAVFSFNIDTKYDIDANDKLILGTDKVPVDLTSTFSVVITLKNHFPTGATYGTIDSINNPGMFSDYDSNAIYLGLAEEALQINLGDALTDLWTACRSIVDPDSYQKYTEIVYATYTEPVYNRDAGGNLMLVKDPDTGRWLPSIAHKVGDRVYVNNEPVILHNVGDTVLDENQNPVIVGGDAAIIRHISMTLFDGRYYFATDSQTKSYITSIIEKIVAWVTVDIPIVQKQLIDGSRLYFHPKTTAGYMDVIIGDNETASVRADQNLRVTYYLSKANYDNTELRKYITDYTPSVLKTALENRTVSVDSIVEALRTAMADDILSVTVTGFVDDAYQIITLTNDSMLPSVGKELVALSSKELRVTDSVTVEFVKHNSTLTS